MTGRLDTNCENGLQFYSKISASISHDFKNALAIINENAGLLDDFTVMADQGMPIDPERLKTLATMIGKQIGRANEIANNMSRLAHSLDQPIEQVDLNETLTLLTELASRSSEMRNVALEISDSSRTINVETSPFFLMTLLWYLLDSAAAVGEVTAVAIAAQERGDGARIVLRFEGNTGELRDILGSQRIDRLLNLLKAKVTAESGTEQISLSLPARIEALNL